MAKRRDAAMLDQWQRHRDLSAATQSVRTEIAAARDAVSILREELASLVRSNAEPAYATQPDRFAYAARLRVELTQAQQRLFALRQQRQQLQRRARSAREAASSTT